MRAQEVQLECVVLDLAQVRRGLALDEYLAVSSGGISADGVEELPPGHGDEPALGVPRRVLRPDAQRLNQGLLHGILGRREVGSATDEDANDGGRQGPQQDLVHHALLRDGRGLDHERAHLEPFVDRFPTGARSRG